MTYNIVHQHNMTTYKRTRNKKGQFAKKSNIILFIVAIAMLSFTGYMLLHTSTLSPTPTTYKKTPTTTIDNIQKLTDNIAKELRELQQAQLIEAQKELEHKQSKLNRLNKEVSLQEAEQAYYLYQGIQ